MKTILLSIASIFVLVNAKAQYTENFEGTEASLTGNCWTLTNYHITTSDVISGNSSVYTNPLVGNAAKELLTPALNVTSNSFDVSFKYQLTNSIHANSTRAIAIGLLSPAGTYTWLDTVAIDSNSPLTVVNYNQTFTLASIGWRKLVIKASGSGGPGNARLVFDDLATNASPLYGAGVCNSAPIATNDVFNGITGQSVSGNVMSNDNEPNGESMQSSMVITSPDGSVVMNSNGSFVFTPNLGFTGLTTAFTYRLTDNGFSPVVSNIGQVTINFADVSLPVELVSFSAALNFANEVELKWTTASEKNVSHFSIEKSLDGQNYSEAGIVFAYGNSSETLKYSFTDKNINTVNAGTIYYRLRSVDIDGSYEYSVIRMITIGNQNRKSLSIQTYPNPVTSELKITIPSNWQGKKVVYELINSNGQTATKTIAGTAGQTEAISVNSLAPGLYIVRAICGGAVAQQKIIKR